MIAKFIWEPITQRWVHGATGVAFCHWDTPEAYDRIEALAQQQVRTALEAVILPGRVVPPITVDFDLESFRRPAPIHSYQPTRI